MDEHLNQAYIQIDDFLKKLNTNGGDTILHLGQSHLTPTNIAFDILFDQGLITSRKSFKDRTGAVDITPKGIEILKAGGYESYLKAKLNKENQDIAIQSRKDQVDLELAEKTLKEFPLTKKRATIAFWIAIGLALIEVVKLFIDFNKQ